LAQSRTGHRAQSRSISRPSTRRINVTEDSDEGDNDRKPPKQVSIDGSTGDLGGEEENEPFFAYDANYLIDNKLGIIVDAEGTRAKPQRRDRRDRDDDRARRPTL